jgi:hypothetical protein
MEREYRPNGEQFAGGSQHDQNGVNPVDALVEQTRLHVSDIGQYYDMWVGLLSESTGYIPENLTETVRNVSYGLGFLFYQQWGEMGYTGEAKQVAFQKRLQRHNSEQFTLPFEDAVQLQRAASLVSVEYDPGEPESTPENVAKRTFIFTDLEQRVHRRDVPDPTRVVDAEQ